MADLVRFKTVATFEVAPSDVTLESEHLIFCGTDGRVECPSIQLVTDGDILMVSDSLDAHHWIDSGGGTLTQADMYENTDAIERHDLPIDVIGVDDALLKEIGDRKLHSNRSPTALLVCATQIETVSQQW